MIARNERYLTPDGEEIAGSEQFIYRTPYARYITPSIPLLTPESELNMARYTTGIAPVGTFLTNFLTALLTPRGTSAPVARSLQMTCSYRYSLSTEVYLPVEIPILLTVPKIVTPSDALVASIAEQIEEWMTQSGIHPAIAGQGSFLFTLSLFNQAGENPLPVLKLNTITLDAALIAPAPKETP